MRSRDSAASASRWRRPAPVARQALRHPSAIRSASRAAPRRLDDVALERLLVADHRQRRGLGQRHRPRVDAAGPVAQLDARRRRAAGARARRRPARRGRRSAPARRLQPLVRLRADARAAPAAAAGPGTPPRAPAGDHGHPARACDGRRRSWRPPSTCAHPNERRGPARVADQLLQLAQEPLRLAGRRHDAGEIEVALVDADLLDRARQRSPTSAQTRRERRAVAAMLGRARRRPAGSGGGPRPRSSPSGCRTPAPRSSRSTPRRGCRGCRRPPAAGPRAPGVRAPRRPRRRRRGRGGRRPGAIAGRIYQRRDDARGRPVCLPG